MTPKERAAMQQALETLCNAVKPKHGFYYSLTEVPIDCAYKYQEAITALREALDHFRDATKKVAEQAEQEPVAWMFVNDDGECEEIGYGKDYLKGSEMMADFQPLFAAPVSIQNESETVSSLSTMRTTVRTKDLTEEDINELWNTALMIADPTAGNLRFKFARAVIAAYKEKNK